MKLRQLFEAPQKRTAVVAFGRMNPPTIGHQKLVEKLKSYDGDHYVFLSQTQKPKTDPLAFADKLRFAKFFFPEITIGHPDVRTPMDMMAMLQRLGYTDIIYVAGSDRVEGFKKLFNDYNGKPDKSGNIGYTFDSIEVVSAGERDPDADGAEGMSASKMRAAAAEDNLEDFTNGTPRPELADEMFKAVRNGMGLKDTVAAESIGAAINFPGYEKDDEEKKKKKKKSKSLLAKLKSIVGIDESLFEAATAADADAMITAIKTFQQAAGLEVDGIVGPNTRAKAAEMIKDPAQAQTVTTLQTAIKDFQTKAGIAVDGKVGPETMGAVKQAQSGGGTGATAPGAAGDGTRGSDVGAAGAANTQEPQSADQAQASAGQPQAPNQGAQTAAPEDPNTTTPAPTNAPDDGNRGGQEPNAPTAEPEAPAADQKQTKRLEPKPKAQPKVSKELYMQKAPDRNASLANFNVEKMKAKYPEPYLDIPNDDGTVTRAYGPKENLEDFIANDRRGKGLKLSGAGGAAPAAEPEQPGTTDAQNDADSADNATPAPDDGTRGGQEPAQTTPTDGAEQPGQVASQAGEPTTADDEAGQEPETPRTKMYDVNGTQMSGDDISKRINDLLKKQGATESISYRSTIAQYLEEALNNAEKQELQALVNAVQGEEYFKTFLDKVADKLQAAGVNYGGQSAPTQEPTSGPDDGSRGEPQAQADAGDDDFQSGSEYKLDGKKVSRDEYEKAFGKDLSGRANDYNKLKTQIEGLAKQARDEKQKFMQDVLNDPDSKYYQDGIDDDPESPEYAPELQAIDDKYKAKGERLQAKADEMIKDPEVKKFIDNGGKDDFDKLLDGDDDKWDDLFKTDAPEGSAGSKGGEVKSRSSYNNTTTSSSQDGTTTSGSSSSSSTVTRTGGTSKTVTRSGGGSTTRFSARYRDSDESKELKAQAKAVRREEMKAFRDEFRKNNPDAGRFDYVDDPGYEELEKKREDLLQQAEDAREMIHPGGEMDREGNIKYYGKGANKDGTWDGEQFDPNRKK
jgi:peptidoglycan hydrolase-like protein with peptidoglycan-binding domain